MRGGGGVVTILTPLSLSVIWCRNIPDSQGHSLWSRAWLHSGRWEIIASLGKGLEVIWRSFTIVSSLHLGRAEYTKISHLRSEGMGRPEPPSTEGGGGGFKQVLEGLLSYLDTVSCSFWWGRILYIIKHGINNTHM